MAGGIVRRDIGFGFQRNDGDLGHRILLRVVGCSNDREWQNHRMHVSRRVEFVEVVSRPRRPRDPYRHVA